MIDDISNLDRDELLCAYLDGELTEDQRRTVEQTLADDSALAQRLEQLRGADQAFLEEIDAVSDAPMSDGLAALAAQLNADTGEDKVVSISEHKSWQKRLRDHRALAACAAMLSGVLATQVTVSSLQVASNEPASPGVLMASSELFDVIETGASGVQVSVSGDQAATPQMTFLVEDKTPCRVVDVVDAQRAGRLVACRSENVWNVQIASYRAVADTPDGPFVTASGPDPVIEAYLDQVMTSQPLDLEQESRAMADGWRGNLPETNQ